MYQGQQTSQSTGSRGGRRHEEKGKRHQHTDQVDYDDYSSEVLSASKQPQIQNWGIDSSQGQFGQQHFYQQQSYYGGMHHPNNSWQQQPSNYSYQSAWYGYYDQQDQEGKQSDGYYYQGGSQHQTSQSDKYSNQERYSTEKGNEGRHFQNPSEELSYIKYLMSEKYKVFETQDKMQLRTKSIQHLQEIVEKWHFKVGADKKIDRTMLETKKAKVLVFGSYRLGVHFAGTDIDSVCVFPNFVSKDEFWEGFKAFVSTQENISDVLHIQEAQTPIIKLKVFGISFDLLFAAVDVVHINSQNDIEKLIFNEQQFRQLSRMTQRSLNGYLCNANIQKNVPNYNVFRNFLRIIKLWAKRRAIYSAMFGYLTGISTAVLVAKIHQEHPDYEVADLVYKFFEVYGKSDWRDPVTIKFGKKEKISLSSWKNALDQVDGDLMAILSPNYELRNTTQRVKEPTFSVIVAEFKRGYEILQELTPISQKCFLAACQNRKDQTQLLKQPTEKAVSGEEAPEGSLKVASWTKFFKRYRFFGKRYEHFLRIDIVANSIDGTNDTYLEWLGFVESQLFILLNMIAKQQEVMEVRAFPTSFKNSDHQQYMELGLVDPAISKFKFVDTYFFGFKLHKFARSQMVSLEDNVSEFCQKLDIGRIQKASTDVRILHFKRNQLPAELVKQF